MSSSEPPRPGGSYPPQGPPPGGPPPGGPPPPGYPPAGGGYPPYPGGGGNAPPRKNFFAALFDITFSTFITPTIIKVVYLLLMIVLVIGWLVFTIAAFAENAGAGILALLLGAVAMVIYLAFIRMTLEFYLAVVRMSEDINRRLPGA